MQFQSDIAHIAVQVPELEELSGMGAAYAAGVAVGLYDLGTVYERIQRLEYGPVMEDDRRNVLYRGWKQAVRQTLTHD